MASVVDRSEAKSSGGGPEVRTEYATIPMVPKANANKTNAVTSAPLPRTLRPLISAGESSKPMTTESLPVPNASPKAMRLQNSTVAQAKGKIPARKTQKSVLCTNDCRVVGFGTGVTASTCGEVILPVVEFFRRTTTDGQ